MEIANWMSRSPACISPNDTLAAAKKLMGAGQFRRLPVVENDKLVGIITERDLRQHWGYLDSTKVNAAMTLRPGYGHPEKHSRGCGPSDAPTQNRWPACRR